MLRRVWTALVRTWEAWQVELHGKYSVERTLSFSRYSLRTSLSRALVVISVTPLPCLLSVILVDLIPLEAPEKGLAHSHTLWVRLTLISWVVNAVVLKQSCYFVPQLPIPAKQIFVVTFFVAMGGTAFVIGLSCVIGYPLPFTLWLISPGCFVLLIGISMILWGKHVRGKPAVQSAIKHYVNLMSAQILMVFIYPLYNSVFVKLTASSQTVFALLLPLMKILAKNVMAYLVRDREDMKPEAVIFNVEIFHALFVTYCMQQSNSINTTAVLISVDFVQACAGLHDVHLMLKSLQELLNVGSSFANHQPSTVAATRQQVTPSFSGNTLGDANMLDVAMYVLSIDERIRSSASLRLNSRPDQASMQTIAPSRSKRTSSNQGDVLSRALEPVNAMEKNCRRKLQQATAVVSPVAHRSAPSSPSINTILDELAQMESIDDDLKQRLQAMSRESRLLFVQKTLQLLHFTEFLLLIEFTEVIIPAIYCVYLGVISHLPNRQHYVNLRGFDDAALHKHIANAVIYASLEVLSLIMLAVLLSRKLRISPLKQLTFVLESQWQLVQSKLILWVLFSVQTSLVHFGVDYSFRFAWLRKST